MEAKKWRQTSLTLTTWRKCLESNAVRVGNVPWSIEIDVCGVKRTQRGVTVFLRNERIPFAQFGEHCLLNMILNFHLAIATYVGPSAKFWFGPLSHVRSFLCKLSLSHVHYLDMCCLFSTHLILPCQQDYVRANVNRPEYNSVITSREYLELVA